MTPPDAHRDVGVHTMMLVDTPGFWGTGSEQLRRGTVLFYPCSHMNSKSVFVGTGSEPLPGVPRFIPC